MGTFGETNLEHAIRIDGSIRRECVIGGLAGASLVATGSTMLLGLPGFFLGLGAGLLALSAIFNAMRA